MQRRLDTVLDTMRVPSEGNPLVAVRAIDHGAPVKRIESEVLIAGGGLGGVAAALAVSRRGHSVCLLEESDWLGGQATSQGVSALDEHPYIEAFGGTRSYYHLRESIRGCAISWDLGVLAPVLGV
ncbi:MAG: FAD-dependent oxidoreductase, partial [bacterium]|nr:FAD-dependent oxidoreductase [bacterium]MDE0288593.1 FAD-dependent oxidoreductase [bacterium]MDE0439892.1 FAD-dependent oxidoreductase [bacterium]